MSIDTSVATTTATTTSDTNVLDNVASQFHETVTSRISAPISQPDTDYSGSPFKRVSLYGRLAVNIKDSAFPINPDAKLIERPEALKPVITCNERDDSFIRIRWDDVNNLEWWMQVTINQWETPSSKNLSRIRANIHLEGRALPIGAEIYNATIQGANTLVINWTAKNSPFWAELLIDF